MWAERAHAAWSGMTGQCLGDDEEDAGMRVHPSIRDRQTPVTGDLGQWSMVLQALDRLALTDDVDTAERARDWLEPLVRESAGMPPAPTKDERTQQRVRGRVDPVPPDLRVFS